MKSSEALLIAREKILTGESRFVCLALPLNMTGLEVRLRITEAISPYKTVIGWLIANHQPWCERCVGWYQGDRFDRAYRIAWIDWMIEGYKAKGD
jgi:hypothetical protein